MRYNKVMNEQSAIILRLLETGPKKPQELANAIGLRNDQAIHTYLDRAIVNLPIYKDEDSGKWYLLKTPEPVKLVRRKTGKLISGMNWNGIGGISADR